MTPPAFPASLEPAYRHCQKLAAEHYENFPVASLLLPGASRPHVAALYAFARTADDFADEPLSFFAGQKGTLSTEAGKPAKGDGESLRKWRLREINRWEKGLKDALQGKPAPDILKAFAHTLKAFHIPVSLPLDLLKAYRMDLSIQRYAGWKDVLYYCRHSADPVGRMVLYISGFREEKLHRWSDFICSGLQLVNFWQDTSIDLGRNRIYYPREELKRAGVREKDLLALRDSPQVRRLVQNAADFTEAHFRKGRPLLDSVPGRLGLELKATYLGGLGILHKIRRMDYNVLHRRPALDSWDGIRVVLKALLGRVESKSS